MKLVSFFSWKRNLFKVEGVGAGKAQEKVCETVQNIMIQFDGNILFKQSLQ